METNHEPQALRAILPGVVPAAEIQEQSRRNQSEIFDDIPLTPEERDQALASARERKFYRLQEEEKLARAAELRRMLTERWNYEKTREWAQRRASQMWPTEEAAFGDHVDVDGNQVCNAGSVFTLLCLYFAVDPAFVVEAGKMGVPRPDLRKGLFLAGRIGCGKTSLMRVFQRNQRQVFMIQSAKEIAWNWRQADKEAGAYLERMCNPLLLPVNDVQNFYHRMAGLCIDDVGTEEVQNSWGNRASVIADVIEGRYFNGCAGPLLHLTTNLITADIREAYGERVASRLRETMNIIQYVGEDRRK